MKILHISINSPYTEEWGYQENTLLKVQASQGHKVMLIATCQQYSADASGEIIEVEPGSYTNKDEVEVVRVKPEKYFKSNIITRILNRYGFTYHNINGILDSFSPDIIFIHGLGHNITIRDVFAYVRKHHDKCKLFGDSHSIMENDPYNTTKQKIIFKLIIKPYLNKNYNEYDKFFYLTPACKEFTIKKYGVPKEKMEFLPLGYDPFLCDWDNRYEIRRNIRNIYNISEDTTVIIHGGKIIKSRRTIELIQAYSNIKSSYDGKLCLLIFGGISNEMKDRTERLIETDDSIIYVGSLSKKEYYDLYLASDIAAFPGGQSVLWQESIGCGLPVILGWAEGLEYLDVGGNVRFVDGLSVKSISKGMLEVLKDEKYKTMAMISAQKGREFFSYERIAKIACGEIVNE